MAAKTKARKATNRRENLFGRKSSGNYVPARGGIAHHSAKRKHKPASDSGSNSVLDDIAKSLSKKPYKSLSASQQATVRAVASKMNKGRAAAAKHRQNSHTGKYDAARIAKREELLEARRVRRSRRRRHVENSHKKRKTTVLKFKAPSRKSTAAAVSALKSGALGLFPLGSLVANRGKKKKTRKNPLEAAEQVYRDFHGRDPQKVVEVSDDIHYHKFLSGIGDLKQLVIEPVKGNRRITVTFGRGSILAQNEKRNQLFIRGGDQSVDLAVFKLEKPYHEMEILGRCMSVDYFTRKDHLRPEDGGTAIYRHKFGRHKPTVIYDTLNKLLSFAGGGYTIPDEGIDR